MSFTSRTSSLLFDRYPEWEKQVVEWESSADRDVLVISVPSRFEPHCPLRIEIGGSGLIISWAGWHDHYDDWGGGEDGFTEEEFTREALETLEALISERIAVVIGWNEGPDGSGGICQTGTLDQELKQGWPRNHRNPVVCVSWKGSYDRGPFVAEKVRW